MKNKQNDLINKTFGHKVRIRACGVHFLEDRLLLVGHQLSDQKNELFWSFPGGGVQYGESVEETIIREFKEETGLTVRIGSFLFVYEYLNPPLHALEIYFSIEATEGELMAGNDPELPDEQQLIQEVAYLSDLQIKEKPKHLIHGIFQKINHLEDLKTLNGYF